MSSSEASGILPFSKILKTVKTSFPALVDSCVKPLYPAMHGR